MKRSPSIDIVLSLAVNEAVAGQFGRMLPEHLFMGLLKFSELNPVTLGNILGLGQALDFLKEELAHVRVVLSEASLDSTRARRAVRQGLGRGGGQPAGPTMHRSPETKALFQLAEAEAGQRHEERLTPAALLRACLFRPTPLIARVIGREPAEPVEADPDRESPLDGPPDIGRLTRALKDLRALLLSRVFGQDHAVHDFVEGLFNAEAVAAADTERVRPKAVFVFAGPPGVGKTHLAETGARALGRPFQRFDMSGYGDAAGVHLLAGAQRSFQGAKAGLLTAFVNENRDAVLLFDEIEKADPGVIHLFLQILDHGVLQDRFTETEIPFRDTVIIFTTNAGRSLYEETAGGPGAGALFHRRTILSALERETDPRTNRPFFPQAICSRMATGRPIMFNHLGVTELETIARKELERTGGLLTSQYGPELEFGAVVPICLVMREGTNADARTVRSQAEAFVKSELFAFFSLHAPERLTGILEKSGRIVFDLDPSETLTGDLAALLTPENRLSVLLALRPGPAAEALERLENVDLLIARDLPSALNALAARDFDVVIVDLWFDAPESTDTGDLQTVVQFAHQPSAARSLRRGQELLRHVRERHPETPIHLLSFPRLGQNGAVSEELLLSAVRAGGVRGVLELDMTPGGGVPPQALEALAASLADVGRRIRRNRQAGELGARRLALAFETAPAVSADGEIRIRLRNLRTTRATSAEDVGGVLDDAERPATRFADVFGADQAKAELGFIVNWLRNPKQFQELGLSPPRGILLCGPPGTGKTLLARALAGESSAAFIVESATNFVTRWVGSGPENVRRIFGRARRYAPSILFIDEIDAIGRKRSADGHHRSHEETLNALLTEMDGFETDPRRPVIVLAATNLAESLDEALLRRFDRDVEVDKPDRAARSAYLAQRLQGGPRRQVSSEVVERLAGQSAGMTIALLERVVQLALRRAATADGVITDARMEEAFETMRMGEAHDRPDAETLLRVARHEAGHCLVGWTLGERPVQVTIVGRGRAGGYVERESDEGRLILTRGRIEDRICQAMAGRAAEVFYYGEVEGQSTGVSGDLQTATRLAEAMAREYGMSPEIGPVAVESRSARDGVLALRVQKAVRRIIQDQQDRAVEVLARQRPALDRLVDALLDKNRLTRDELQSILSEVESSPE